MRRHAIASAAVVCLATAACTAADPAETPDPTTVTTTTVAMSEPAASEAPGAETETPNPGPPTGDTESDPGGSDGTSPDVDLADHAFAVTPQQAIATAQEGAGNGILYSIELDWSEYNDAWVYGLDIINGTTDHEFDISADTGEILDHDQDDSDDQEQEVSLDAPMTWEAARDKALGAAPGRITGWELDWEDAHPTFKFEIQDSSGDEIDVEVQADTGTVTIDD